MLRMATSYADICDYPVADDMLKCMMCKQAEPYLYLEPDSYTLEELDRIIDCIHELDEMLNVAHSREPVADNIDISIIDDLSMLSGMNVPWDNLYYSEIQTIAEIHDNLRFAIE